MKKLIWNTQKNSKSFWGEYHYNASSNWIFYLLEKIKYEIYYYSRINLKTVLKKIKSN